MLRIRPKTGGQLFPKLRNIGPLTNPSFVTVFADTPERQKNGQPSMQCDGFDRGLVANVAGLNKKKKSFLFFSLFPHVFPVLLHFSACAHKKIVFSL